VLQILGALAVIGGFILVSYETREGSHGRTDMDPTAVLEGVLEREEQLGDDDEEEVEVDLHTGSSSRATSI